MRIHTSLSVSVLVQWSRTMNSKVENQLNFIRKKKKNTALFMVYQIGGDEEEEGENEVFMAYQFS